MAALKRVIKKQLGELLVEQRIINKDQLKEALEIQKTQGGLIGEILVTLGHLKEEDIAQVLTLQYGFPYLPLANYQIDSQVLKLIPENVCRQYCLIPIDRIGNSLTFAISNPLNTKAIEDIEFISGCSVQIFVGTTSEIKKSIDKYYNKG